MKNVVIIGAGPAGLTAALELLRRSGEYNVTVLEADEVVGGISVTVKTNGNRMDIGGHRFYTKSERVLKFWESIMPMQGKPALDELITGTEPVLTHGGADPEKSDEVMLSRRRVSRIYRKGKLYNYPVDISTVKTMGIEAIPSAFSYIWARIKKRKENTLEDFYINRFGKKLYSTFFESYTQKVWGLHPSEMPPDWGEQRVRGLSVWRAVRDMLPWSKQEERSLIKRFMYPKFGPGQLWECCEREIRERGGKIIFNSRVSGITVNETKITSVTAAGAEYPADIVISSMPLSDLIKAMGEAVPKSVQKTAQGLKYRDFITVGVEVPELKFKNKTKHKTINNIPPDCWIYVQDPRVRMGRLQIFNNWSPYMVRDTEKSVFIGTEYFCSEGDEFWSMSDDEIVHCAVSELEKIGLIEKESAKNTKCVRMKKTYPSYSGSYGRIEEIREYADSMENLYCVGRNGQHRYNNMDHSMLTAMAAVDAVISGGEKSDLWSVNPDGYVE